METNIDAIRASFGVHSFRGVQEPAIRDFVAGRHVIAVMATGMGKSLIYRVASQMKRWRILIVSPTIALRHDQVRRIHDDGGRAVVASDASSIVELQVNKSLVSLPGAATRPGDFVFASPEFIVRQAASLATVGIDAVVFDEAHLLLDWSTFRSAFSQVGAIVRAWNLPTLALTATAPLRRTEAILNTLHLKPPTPVYRHRGTVDRPNLYHSILHMSSGGVDKTVETILGLFQSGVALAGPSIVYVLTIDHLNRLADAMERQGRTCARYHGSMGAEDRDANYTSFMSGEKTLMFATVAFGLGIDKRDVRNVIQIGPRKSLDEYMQECGRAGRDGNSSKCIMLLANYHWVQINQIVGGDASEETALGLQRMNDYVTTNECRRCYLMRYSDETPRFSMCGTCDNCSSKPVDDDASATRMDVTADARVLLHAVRACKGYYGDKTVIDLIQGIVAKDRQWILEYRALDFSVAHGGTTHRPLSWWKALLEHLVERRICERVFKPGRRIASLNVCENADEVIAMAQKEEGVLLVASTVLPLSSSKEALRNNKRSFDGSSSRERVIDPVVMERLVAYRKARAKADGVPGYCILSNKTLDELAQCRPKKVSDLASVHGIGPQKMEKYGSDLINILCDEKSHVTSPPSTSLPHSVPSPSDEERRSALEDAFRNVPRWLLLPSHIDAVWALAVDARRNARPVVSADLETCGLSPVVVQSHGAQILHTLNA